MDLRKVKKYLKDGCIGGYIVDSGMKSTEIYSTVEETWITCNGLPHYFERITSSTDINERFALVMGRVISAYV